MQMEAGHNSNAQLKSLVERIECIEDEIKVCRGDVSDIYKEAKGNGYDVPALRAIVRARREDTEKRQAREAQIEIYRGALGID
jgi:uncharacterized protein (UPF0335 family)